MLDPMEPSSTPPACLVPLPLRPGDTIRFVSPASRPDRDAVLRSASVLEGWGLRVEFGAHAFDKLHFLAGCDSDRLADVNDAIRDPRVRAIFATRGGKGSYRIAHALDFEAMRADPKMLVGYSDITALHLSLYQSLRIMGVHGAVRVDDHGTVDAVHAQSLQQVLFARDDMVVRTAGDPTASLTTRGSASGVLVGGNLDMIATCAGWALPRLTGKILLIEAVDRYLGHVDRILTMLIKGGHLDGLAGLAIGQFTGFEPSGGMTVVELLRDHLAFFDVPILGGLPVGHGRPSVAVPLGLPSVLDADAGTLTISFATSRED